jgi:hypothetical protein
MKVYTNSIDWADEGDVFFFSLETEENLSAMRELLKIAEEIDLNIDGESYWGTNEFFDFAISDFLDFIDSAQDVSDEEIATFEKFKISGFDIYSQIKYILEDSLVEWDSKQRKRVPLEHLTEEDWNRIEPFYVQLFGQENWDDIQKAK